MTAQKAASVPVDWTLVVPADGGIEFVEVTCYLPCDGGDGCPGRERLPLLADVPAGLSPGRYPLTRLLDDEGPCLALKGYQRAHSPVRHGRRSTP